MNWTSIEAYLSAPSLLDLDYCRSIYNGCRIANQSAYDWFTFIDACGLDDDGDTFTHTVHPEPRA